MYKLEFKLKQHSPIIHFQHDQDGATLRASEVKPKLDKYIIEKKGGEEYVRLNFPNWFLSSNTSALNYKLTLHASGNSYSFEKSIVSVQKILILFEEINCKIHSYDMSIIEFIRSILVEFFILYNFGNRTSKGYGSFTVKEINHQLIDITYDDVKFVLQSYYNYIGALSFDKDDPELFRFDLSNLFRIPDSVFADKVTNLAYKKESRFVYELPAFDTTTIIFDKSAMDRILVDYNEKCHLKKNTLLVKYPDFSEKIENSFSANYEKYKKLIFVSLYNTLLDTVESDNRLLKSGVNPGRPNAYRKSHLFLAFIANNFVWEKRLIKKRINSLSASLRFNKLLPPNSRPPSINNNISDNSWHDLYQLSNYRFIRMLLGMPEQYEFKTNQNNFKFIVQFKSTAGIERFQSPILNKIFENNILVCLKNDYNQILDKSFDIEFYVKEKVSNVWVNRATSMLYEGLRTPTMYEIKEVNFDDVIINFFKEMSYDEY